jgi:hypothetical protein
MVARATSPSHAAVAQRRELGQQVVALAAKLHVLEAHVVELRDRVNSLPLGERSPSFQAPSAE